MGFGRFHNGLWRLLPLLRKFLEINTCALVDKDILIRLSDADILVHLRLVLLNELFELLVLLGMGFLKGLHLLVCL